MALLLLANHAAEGVFGECAVERVARALRPLRLNALDRGAAAEGLKCLLQVAGGVEGLSLAVRCLVLLDRDVLVVLYEHVLEVV